MNYFTTLGHKIEYKHRKNILVKMSSISYQLENATNTSKMLLSEKK